MPTGDQERFNGYGVMGLPFASGHVLAMRRFFASSVGPGYQSVWYRNPAGDWIFYATALPNQACSRYFGFEALDAVETDVHVEWTGPFHIRITIHAIRFEWEIDLGSTAATRVMNTLARLLPGSAWRNPAVLWVMEKLAGLLLGAGRVGLHGLVPNGQRFIANPRTLWAVTDTRASLDGRDFGPPGHARPQAHLRDFWIPQRGMFAIGQAYFEPFDPSRHSPLTSGARTSSPSGRGTPHPESC